LREVNRGLDEEAAFTKEQALRLTGASPRRLSYWMKTGLLTPAIQRTKGTGKVKVRLFSFANLLELRVAVWLRDTVSLQLIRKIVDRLRERGLLNPLSSVRFGVIEYPLKSGSSTYEVVMQMDDGRWESWRQPGQLIMELTVPIQTLAESLEQKIESDRARRSKVGHVERRRGVMGSTPVVAGTRVPTRAIYDLHLAGYPAAKILESYPGISKADVEAAVRTEAARRRRKLA
jgi:uncharacterized protein (DUF433 family)